MSLLLLPKQYKDGSVLYKTALDAIVAALLSFFNSQKLGSDNIQTGGLTSASLDSTTASALPIGSVIEWPLYAAPNSQWMLADGTAISRTTYSALFTQCGTIYGAGDGSTTFNIPDIRGRAIAGLVHSGSSPLTLVDATTLGAAGGNQGLADHTHTAGTATLGPTGSPHTHNITDNGHYHEITANYQSVGGSGAYVPGNIIAAAGASRDPGNPITSTPNTSGASTSSELIGTTDNESFHAHTLLGTSGITGVANNGSVQPAQIGAFVIRVS